MIIDFTVENFGSIKEPQTISFKATKDNIYEDVFVAIPDGKTRLMRMVMLLGPHGAGKSTMLDALSTCRDSMPTRTIYDWIRVGKIGPYGQHVIHDLDKE